MGCDGGCTCGKAQSSFDKVFWPIVVGLAFLIIGVSTYALERKITVLEAKLNIRIPIVEMKGEHETLPVFVERITEITDGLGRQGASEIETRNLKDDGTIVLIYFSPGLR